MTTLKPLIPRVDLAENQIIRWSYRLPDMAIDDDDDNDHPAETVVSAIEVRKELQTFQDAVRRKVAEVREVITAIEERMNILRRAQEDAWELVTDRVASEVDRASATFSDRVTEVERVVQSQSASPASTNDQHPSVQENFVQLESRIEARFQAFTQEVDLLREEVAQSIEGNGKSVKKWTRTKLSHVTAQLRGLKNFTKEVETYVREKCSSQEGRTSAQEAITSQACEEVSGRNRCAPAEPAGASSSSTRPPAY